MDHQSEDPLYRDPEFAAFYDLGDRSGIEFDRCAALAAEAATVLDLGCGTGELAARLGATSDVTGVDPAAAMLEIARARPGAASVTWVEGDARNLSLDRSFELIVLTGHAYQVFLTDEDQAAALSTIAAHLTPNGRFIFDSRDPEYRLWDRRDRNNTRRELEHPEDGRVAAWSESVMDEATGVLTYTNSFRIERTGEVRSGSAEIRFTPKLRLAELIARAGLAVDAWYGDWDFTPHASGAKDLIPLGRLA